MPRLSVRALRVPPPHRPRQLRQPEPSHGNSAQRRSELDRLVHLQLRHPLGQRRQDLLARLPLPQAGRPPNLQLHLLRQRRHRLRHAEERRQRPDHLRQRAHGRPGSGRQDRRAGQLVQYRFLPLSVGPEGCF